MLTAKANKIIEALASHDVERMGCAAPDDAAAALEIIWRWSRVERAAGESPSSADIRAAIAAIGAARAAYVYRGEALALENGEYDTHEDDEEGAYADGVPPDSDEVLGLPRRP